MFAGACEHCDVLEAALEFLSLRWSLINPANPLTTTAIISTSYITYMSCNGTANLLLWGEYIFRFLFLGYRNMGHCRYGQRHFCVRKVILRHQIPHLTKRCGVVTLFLFTELCLMCFFVEERTQDSFFSGKSQTRDLSGQWLNRTLSCQVPVLFLGFKKLIFFILR